MIDKCCISINNNCNLACKYCHFYENESLDMQAIKSFDSEKLKLILENILNYATIKNIKCFRIGFAGGGEPLLDFHAIKAGLIHIKNIDKDNRLSFYIITNGILLTQKILEELKNIPCDIVVSLDGDMQTHDAYRIQKNKKGTHATIMQNIELYENIFGNKPPINTTVGKHSIDRKDFILNFFKENNFKNLTFTRLFHCDDKTLEISQYDFNNFIAFFAKEKDFKIRNIEAQIQNKHDCIMYGNKCGVGLNNIFYFNNHIYPCMRYSDDIKSAIGLFNQSLFDIEKNMQTKYNKSTKGCYYEEY